MKSESIETRRLFTEEAAQIIRNAIIDANGNEVFFGANLDGEGRVRFVEILARGNESSVPAIMNKSVDFDVVVHNHPSGRLDPSNEDIGIASQLGNAATGSYIVNNDVTDVYVVVPAPTERSVTPLDIPKILYLFTETGDLPKLLKTFESRYEQTVMAERVMEAFNENKHLVVEAGTGVGKSLAYIVPALFWLKQNGGRIVISTNTINLQQQIIEKDLPAVVNALAPEINYILVKGRNNYVCARKVKRLAAKDGEQFAFDLDDEQDAFVNDIAQWLTHTDDGSVNDLTFKPRNDFWEIVQSEGDTCLKTKCPEYTQCFFYKMKKRVKSAQLLVVNHHILCAELSIHAESMGQGFFLPRYEKVIVDEAHNFEDSASKYFGQEGSRAGIVKNLNFLYQRKGSKTFGHAHQLRRIVERYASRVDEKALDALSAEFDRFFAETLSLRDALDMRAKDFLRYCRERLEQKDESSFRFRISEALSKKDHWQEQGAVILKEIASALRKVVNTGEAIKTDFLEIALAHTFDDYRDTVTYFATYTDRLKEILEALNVVLNYKDDDRIRWLEVSLSRRGALYLKWHATPVEVGDYLNRYMYDRFESVIMTSATLTVSGTFDFFLRRAGLDRVDASRLLKERLESPYDYERHARLYIARDTNDPSSPQFLDDVARYIYGAMQITGGRAFVLFTSFGMLKGVYDRAAGALEKIGVNALTQSGERHRNILLELFKSSSNNVLFGVDSFWEGVDVVGKNLEMIIMPKLPFTVPTDPIGEARQEYVEKQGGNAFMDYALPLAAIKFKQGFGRLIRSKKDKGVVLALDKRMIAKNYGRAFVKSLPNVKTITGTMKEIMTDMQNFFDEA